MNINRKTWIIFSLLAIVSLAVWFKFSYPKLAFPNFSVNRNQAIAITDQYLTKKGVNTENFETAAVFKSDNKTNRYLQKSIGFAGLTDFIKEHDFDMFFWIVRYFQKGEKEEYRLSVSSATGEIIAYKHIIDDNETRSNIDRDLAEKRAVSFLTETFQFDKSQSTPSGDILTKFDNRLEYAFSWHKDSVHIPWSEREGTGDGKLVTSARISGDEILTYSKHLFKIPGQFTRDLKRKKTTGQNITTIIKVFYYIVFTASVFFVIVRRNHLAMHVTKQFYIWVMIISFILSLLNTANQLQVIIYNYQTTSPFDSYLWRYIINTTRVAMVLNIAILIPALAGELLRFEMAKNKPYQSFLHNIQSTFLSRPIAKSIGLGYFVFIILLGFQSLLLHIGESYLGVWTEYTWMPRMATNYFPFLAAFTLGFKASIFEELFYRLFAINWGKKIFKNTFLAVVFSSLLWGFSHSSYPVFPMWFRGIEVTCLGFFLSFVYLRFGLLPVIVGHYLFNSFWGTSGYLLGQTQPSLFYASLGVLVLPALFGLVAFLFNGEETIRPMFWHLNDHQKYNVNILVTFLQTNEAKFTRMSPEEIKDEINAHGWDIAVVDTAVNQFKGIEEGS